MINMKNNFRRIFKVINFVIILITLILFVFVLIVDHFEMTSMQGIITKLVYLDLFIIMIINCVRYFLDRKYK